MAVEILPPEIAITPPFLPARPVPMAEPQYDPVAETVPPDIDIE
jgi:hypothetical protein